MPVEFESVRESHRSEWYVSAIERLVGVVQELSTARDLDAITSIVRIAARELTGADGASFVLRDGDQCFYADENAIAPLWKGKRFPMAICASGWVMNHARPAVIKDIYADPRVPVEAYRPTFVKSMAMVPIRRNSPIGAIGNYWATPHQPTDEEVAVLQALADTTSVALENAELYGRLQQQVITLRAQEARIREQHAALEVFTRALAHDLKEPVRTLTSFSRMIGQPGESAEDQQTYVDFIQAAGDRMSMLIESVFEYMQLDEPSMPVDEACDMQSAVEGARQNLAKLIADSGAVIESGALPQVRAGRVHMLQVVQNLVANAIRHNTDPVKITITAEQHGDSVRFAVRDNGCGFAPEHATKIFEPFKRLTRLDGCAGLGLAICRKIVQRYGGTIECESQPGQGANFYFTLPGADAMNAHGQAATPLSDTLVPQQSGMACVLLVDDRVDDMKLTSIVLEKRAKLQCQLVAAQGGQEALAVMGRQPVDLVLLDINMPGMDGFELLERMRQDESTKRIPVIMCTRSNYEKDKERARSLGASGYLLKPPSFDKLRPMLENVPTVKLAPQDNGFQLLRHGA